MAALCVYVGGLGEVIKAGKMVTFDRNDTAAVMGILYSGLMRL